MKFKLFNFACLAILLLLQNFNIYATNQLNDPNWRFCYGMTKKEGISKGCNKSFYGQ
jgi:hypothetical protein